MRYAILLLLLATAAVPVQAQRGGVGYYGKAIAEPARKVDPSDIKIEQRLGEQVPLDLEFKDEQDHDITLGSCVAGKPTVLVLAYYRCPQLCNVVLNNLLDAFKKMPGYTIGDQFNVVVVSFDPKDKPPIAYAKKWSYLEEYGRAGADKGWHFLCGEQKQIDELCKAVGFRYEYDSQKKQFNHASGIMVITPYGKLSKYFYGITYDDPISAADKKLQLEAALEEAGTNKIGNAVEPNNFIAMLCGDIDPVTGKYSLSVMKGLRIFFGAMVLGLAFWLIRVWRRPAKTVSLTTDEAATS